MASEEQAEEKDALAPLKVRAMVEVAAKPEPVKVAELPTEPEVGELLTAEVTVKAVEAELVPSLTATVWAPAVAAGTVKAQEKLPLALEEQAAEKDRAAPPKVRVMACEAMKPVPLTVVLLPTAPEVGVRLMAATTVKVAEAGLVPSLTEAV